MTTASKTNSAPTLNLQLVSKYVQLDARIIVPRLRASWLFTPLVVVIVWFFPSLLQYANLFISLLGK